MKTICIILAFVILSLGCITLFKRVADFEKLSTLESESAVETIDSGFSFVKRFSKDDFTELNGSKYMNFERAIVVPRDRAIRVVAKLNGEANFCASAVSLNPDFVLPESETKTLSGVWKLNDELTISSVISQEINFRFVGLGSTVSCTSMETKKSLLGYSLYYNFETVPSNFKYSIGNDIVYNGSTWVTHDRYTPNLFDFGSDPQEVSAEFYEWFAANASACMTNQLIEFELNGTGVEEIYYFSVSSVEYSNMLYLDEMSFEGTGEVEWIEIHVEYEPSKSEEATYKWVRVDSVNFPNTSDSMGDSATVHISQISSYSELSKIISDGGKFRISCYTNDSSNYLSIDCTVDGEKITLLHEDCVTTGQYLEFEFYPGVEDVISDINFSTHGVTSVTLWVQAPT